MALSLQKVIFVFVLFNTALLGVFFLTGGYPPLALTIHILSVLFLWGYILYPHLSFENLDKYKLDLLLLLILFIIALTVRMYLIGVVTPGVDGDEIAVARSSEELSRIGYTPFIFNNYGHGTIIPYMVGWSIALFGKSIDSLRFTSALFGALGVCALYGFLRLFLQRFVAFMATVLFAGSYAHLALSRVIFEPTASMFFELLTLIFFLLAYKKHDLAYFVGLGLVLSLGNYTYVNFRLFTLFVFLALIGMVWLQKISIQQKLMAVAITVTVCLASLAPLLHYSTLHPDHIMARANVLSVFNQHLPATEVTQNIIGATGQLRFLFLSPGDPNTRINPAVTSMFDLGTTLLFLLGCVYLGRKSRRLLFLLFFLALPFIFSDIFSYEAGPANTFYGFAHPNTLRISGIIPLVYIVVALGIGSLEGWAQKFGKTTFPIFLCAAVAFLCFSNISGYFYQRFIPYTYIVNGVQALDMVKFINTSPYATYYISPTIATDPRFTYFQQRFPTIKSYPLETTQQAQKAIAAFDVVIIDAYKNTAIAQELAASSSAIPGKVLRYHQIPTGQVDTLIYIPQ